MNRFAILALIIASSIIASGCIQGKIGKPEIRGIDHKWGSVTNEITEIITEITVYNPNPFPLPLKDIQTEIYMNGIKMGEGSALKSDIRANSESKIVISTKIQNDRIPEWWVHHIMNGETSTVKIIGYLVFDLKITEFRYPIEKTSTIKTDILSSLSSTEPRDVKVGHLKLTVKSVRSYWGDVSWDRTDILTRVVIRNDNPVPIPIIKFHYTVDMNDIRVAEGTSNITAIIKPRSEETLTLLTSIDNRMLDEWWASHIRNGERTNVKVSIEPFVMINDRVFSFKLLEEEFEFKTSILS